MDIIIVRYKAACGRKKIDGLPTDVEALVYDKLKVLTIPTSVGYSDVNTGERLKKAIASMQDLTVSHRRLRGFFQLFDQIADDERVVLLDAQKYTNYDLYCWIMALRESEKAQNLVEVYHYYKYTLPSTQWPRYDMLMFADFGFDQYIGIEDKTMRICRFCHGHDVEGEKKGIFGTPKNSHAISYFLGNDRLFCLEECKECNEKFGRTIETDLANYYNYYRAAEGRKSREGKNLTAKGFNFEYGNGRLAIFTDKPIENAPKVGESMPKEGIKLNLDNEEPVNLHNIYKLFVKYVIACVPNDRLPDFHQTVKWIKGELKPRKHLLPPIYRIETLDNQLTPNLNVYFRKDTRKDMPYCIGEFRFMENLYVFAVPYCKGKDVFVEHLHVPLSLFMSLRYAGLNFTIENFCDEEPKLITTHVKIDYDGDEVVQPLNPDDIEKNQDWWQKRNMKMMKRFGTTDIHPDREFM